VVLLAAKVKGDDGADKRILVRSKSNIGKDDGGFEYHLQQVDVTTDITASIATWGEAITGTARELLAEAEADSDGEDGRDAAEMLRSELMADCWTPVETAGAPLRKAGFTKKQIWAASRKLCVARKKGAMREGWYWRLPGGPDPEMPSDQDSAHGVLEPSSPIDDGHAVDPPPRDQPAKRRRSSKSSPAPTVTPESGAADLAAGTDPAGAWGEL
jgi:putative DNA primase/helicase